MSCECDSYICLEAFFNPCNTGIQLDVLADESGTWVGNIEFNGIWTRFAFGVVSGDYIVIPTQFLNESYTHQLKLYDTEGVLINCYHLKARSMGNAGTYTPIDPDSPAGFNIFQVTADANGVLVSDPRFATGLVMTMITASQSWQRTDDFTQSGEDVTMINGATVTAGQLITVTIKLT